MTERAACATRWCFVALCFFTPSIRADYVPADSMRFMPGEWMNRPGLMSVGGIPHRTTVFKTVSPSGADDSKAIQAAIDACPADLVVQLAAGKFIVNNYILIDKNITLRGEGWKKTILQKTNGAVFNSEAAIADAQPIVILGPGRWPGCDESTSQNLTADAAKGAMSVTVAGAAGFAAGQCVLLDELSGASWQPDRFDTTHAIKVWASPDYRVVWKAHNPYQEYVDDFNRAKNPPEPPPDWFCRMDRPTNEIKQIASVSGTSVTFTSPLHINYRSGHTAQLTRYTNEGNGGVHVTYAGVEDLAVTGASDGSIRFECAAFCWAKNVEVSVWVGEGVAVNNSFRCEIRDSYIHDAAYASPGGGAYAISMAGGSSELLFENNISVRTNKVMVARCCGAGSVFGYNYADDGFINYNQNWIECGLNASHMVGPHHVLFEGNYGFNWDSDVTHGNSIYMTVFRNWLRGVRRPFVNPQTNDTVDDQTSSESGPKRCVGAVGYSGWMTFVGNVLGEQNKMSGWVYDASGPDGWSRDGIWLLGWGAENGQDFDRETWNTAIRDGNFDWVTGKQRWDGLLGAHASTTPVELQNSLYLPGIPAFFEDNPWPWVDPGTGKTAVLPAKARFEALDGNTQSRRAVPPKAGPADLKGTTWKAVRGQGTVNFSVCLDQKANVAVAVYNMAGGKMGETSRSRAGPGVQTLVWNFGRAATGVYVARMRVNGRETQKRLTIVR
jgi:hypothetical protein